MTYLELMESALDAYSTDHIESYFERVKERGLSEHGFPRLTANIGILIAHGRRKDLYGLFVEMMDFCCDQIPKVKAANDFSVREIICALTEIEQSGEVDSERIAQWRKGIGSIVPEKCYNVFARTPDDPVRNWALFTAVSEFFRYDAGFSASMDFIELQIESQLKWLDENGMYMDHEGEDIHQPIMYDIVPRGLFALLLHKGYRGKFYERIDECLRKAGLLTLKMQASNGEMAFGGRSNQFIHNEGWLAAIFSYEAKRYESLGDTRLASLFCSAVARAMRVTEDWLTKNPITHIKNRFPTSTKYGCEGYAYFDKYMITTASNLYAAYVIAGNEIPKEEIPDTEATVFETSYHFHKLFLKCGGYSTEIDTNADPHYDAGGVGRVIKNGAPSAICISLPCPSEPNYYTDAEDTFALSICPAVYISGDWRLGADSDTEYRVISEYASKDTAQAILRCDIDRKYHTVMTCTVSKDGVQIKAEGDGRIGISIPTFLFDGEKHTDIQQKNGALSVGYEGHRCIYSTDGAFADIKRAARNRNGYYKAFIAEGMNTVSVKIEIE